MKNLLFLLCFTFISTTVKAQSDDIERPSVGFNVGPTLSNIRGNEAADKNKYAFNFMAGVSFEHPVSRQFSILANINYERKTFKQDIVFDGFQGNFDPIVDPAFQTGEITFRGTLHYITIPLDIRYYIGESKKIFINAGPYASVFIDDSYTLDGDKTTDGDSEANFKTMDFGINLGIGTKFALSQTQALSVELRHNYGLTDISDMKHINENKVKTNAFNLIVNWSFQL
ncbi:PorT family protein [Flavobacterium alkalisoli]|uniref:PorT family protein n=1 Tax=Flavobacterium alkalisoli TaxID=2602769 RepID=A0A5B9FR33_9FLAO|nr:porin family protein [Flavobacterium alkalisoli]QEE48506.1 PorT family protein [Flavobacterium alkalisoli]